MFWRNTPEWRPNGSARESVAETPLIERTCIIGAATGAGARDTGCQQAPDFLAATDMLTDLRQAGASVSWDRTVRAEAVDGHDDALPITADFCERLADTVQWAVARGQRFCVLGGDHSCAIGTWSGAHHALRHHGKLGLLWVDAHMDAHTPDTSPSGAIHGMPLACLLGYGVKVLCEVGGRRPQLVPANVCLVGVRSYESAETELLETLGVRIFDMDEIRRRGLHAVMDEALTIVYRNTAGFGITIDLDAIDPADAPGVGSPEPGGICGKDLAKSLRNVAKNRAFLGAEIAEFNPQWDMEGKTAALVRELVAAVTEREGRA